MKPWRICAIDPSAGTFETKDYESLPAVRFILQEAKVAGVELALYARTNKNGFIKIYDTGILQRAQELIKLCDIFKCTPDYLLGYVDENLKATEKDQENSIKVYARGGGVKIYKVTPKRLKAIQALLEDDDDVDI